MFDAVVDETAGLVKLYRRMIKLKLRPNYIWLWNIYVEIFSDPNALFKLNNITLFSFWELS